VQKEQETNNQQNSSNRGNELQRHADFDHFNLRFVSEGWDAEFNEKVQRIDVNLRLFVQVFSVMHASGASVKRKSNERNL
jgi:hypothetical protein